MTALTLRLPTDLYESLRREAFDRHVSMNEIIRDALAARFTLPVVPTVTEEMVERGAKAIFAAVDTSHEWEHGLADWRRDRARSASRAALSAALTPEADR